MHPYNVFAIALQSQVVQQVADEFTGIALRLKQERAVDIAFPPLQELEQERGLAHSRLRNKREKTAPRLNPVEQGCEGFPMPGAEVKVARIRCHSERLLTQPVEIEEHGLITTLRERRDHRAAQKGFDFLWGPK